MSCSFLLRRSMKHRWLGPWRASFDFRVAPGDHSPEALTRSGLGDFHHPALPLMWLVARGPLPFEVAVT